MWTAFSEQKENERCNIYSSYLYKYWGIQFTQNIKVQVIVLTSTAILAHIVSAVFVITSSVLVLLPPHWHWLSCTLVSRSNVRIRTAAAAAAAATSPNVTANSASALPNTWIWYHILPVTALVSASSHICHVGWCILIIVVIITLLPVGIIGILLAAETQWG